MTDKSSPSCCSTRKKSPRLSVPTRAALSVLSAVTDLSRRRDGTIRRRLLSILDIPAHPNPRPSRGVRSSDVTVDPARPLWFRLFLPAAAAAAAGGGTSRLPVIVFFHGGGFAFLSAANRAYDFVCRRFARKLPAAVVSVNYRLAPEHKCPAPYDDGVDVLRYLDSNPPPDLAAVADLSNCFLMGDSAGGNIAHHVAKRYASGIKDWTTVRVSGMVIIQPYFGGEERTEAELRLTDAPLVNVERTDWLWRAFLPEGADRDHEAANVFGPRDQGELGEGFPEAVMVVVGGWDPLQDWQRRYAEGLRRRGVEVRVVEYEGAVHAFYVFPDVEEGKMLVKEVKQFVESHIRQE